MATKFNILVLHGPNLNMLGKREPAIYGSHSLAQINEQLTAQAATANVQLTAVQANAEHVLIEQIHQAFEKVDFIIINPAAFTHTSVALRDAMLSVAIPFYEVHISNVHAREAFRHHSYLSDIAEGVITGFGVQGYQFALQAAIEQLQTKNK
ncbi:type II 3-dehydroquinate dehydratase [Flocculibacter collagenilyticus]|uniref:type II 3-dehydroquinate dehydratase n=1 Tax=Flocculibacter collagenilyticus TaxID=2744479 RepID=UPI0018F45BE6|nr:type II 3-dehydroquinate dehydratase [Flocculibacter collagenilyticus]